MSAKRAAYRVITAMRCLLFGVSLVVFWWLCHACEYLKMPKNKSVEPAYRIDLAKGDVKNVGLFILVWNQMELKLQTTVAILLSTDGPLLEAIMGSFNIKPKADIFLAACKQHVKGAKIRSDAESCWKKILGLSGFRNDVAHGMWGFNVDTNKPEARKAMSAKPIDAKDLEKNLGELCQLTCKLADLEWRILNERVPAAFALPSPWHDKF